MSLKDTAERISARMAARSTRMINASRVVKIGLIAGGSLVAGVAKLFTPPSPVWQALGIVGACVAVFGTVFIVMTEEDASKDLEEARRAEGTRDLVISPRDA